MKSVDQEIFGNDANISNDDHKNTTDAVDCKDSTKNIAKNDKQTVGPLIYSEKIKFIYKPQENPLVDNIDTVHESWRNYLRNQHNDSKLKDSYILRVNEMIRQTTLIAWLCHLKFLSDICDHPLTKAAILSIYLLKSRESKPILFFQFICENFQIPKDYDIWCLYKLTSKFIRGALLLKIFRSVYFKKAPVIISTILFVALCRSFGYFCRFILDIPKTFIEMTQNKKKQINIFSQVYDPSKQSWITVNFKYLSFGDFQFEAIKNTPNYSNLPVIANKINDNSTCNSNSVVKLIYNNGIYVFKPEKIFIYTNDLKIKHAIFVPKAVYLTDLSIPKDYLCNIYHILDHSDISFDFSSNKISSDIQSHIKYKCEDKQKGLYIISCCNFGYFYDLTMGFHNKWYNVINKRKRRFHKWLSELISTLQHMCLNNKKIKRYKTQIKFLHQLDDNILRNKINTQVPHVKSWILNHPTFILESQLTSRQTIEKGAKVVGLVKGEKIYYRKDVIQLKTRMGWHREMRKLKPNQQPYRITEIKKKLTHRFFNKGLSQFTHQTLELFSIDQTEPQVITSFNDLTTSFGNIDLTGNRKVPKNSLHIIGCFQEIINLSANHAKIESIPALVSFKYDGIEIKPIIHGIVINSSDKSKFLESYSYVLDSINMNNNDTSIDLWKICFKTLSRFKKDKAKRISGNKLAKLINANVTWDKNSDYIKPDTICET